MSKVRITNKLIINSVVGVIYQMHPYHNPEGINKIVQKINKWCDETPDCNGSIKDTFKLFGTWLPAHGLTVLPFSAEKYFLKNEEEYNVKSYIQNI